MKIHRLKISEIRGIRELELHPEGKHLIVVGQNGTGKSGVADALDFLFTGKIQRLLGEGTAGVTLKTHGKHISSPNSNNSYVEAVVILPDGSSATLKRSLSKPDQLEIDNDSDLFKEALSIASKGHQLLTRKEILNFIAATGKSRASEVQGLLGLEEVESVRQKLYRAYNKLKNRKDAAERSHLVAQRDFIQHVKDFDNERSVVEIVSELRKWFGGEPLDSLVGAEVLHGLKRPALEKIDPHTNRDFLEKTCGELYKLFQEEQVSSFITNAISVHNSLLTLRKDPSLFKEVKQLDLVRRGLGLLSENSKECPLCDLPWGHDELSKHLTQKLDRATGASRQIELIKKDVRIVISWLERVAHCLSTIDVALEKLHFENYEHVKNISLAFKGLLDAFNDLYGEQGNLVDGLTKESLLFLIEKETVIELAQRFELEIKEKLPSLSLVQNRWDFLIRIDEKLKAGNKAKKVKEMELKAFERASRLYDAFLASRENVLSELYESVSEEFGKLYCFLHSEDEGNFSAEFLPNAAGLDFVVDFYGYGKHPPVALHSDGHQDSMGLCLYLVLSKKLAKDFIHFSVLDDVIISIDSGHRIRISDLFIRYFPDRQFIITTHEEIWANMLENGLGRRKCLRQKFYGWDVAYGPSVRLSENFIEGAKRKLEEGELHSAAHELRRGLEEFSAYACENLQAKVPYRSTRGWDLGDFFDSSSNRMGALLKKSLKEAQKVDVHVDLIEDSLSAFNAAKEGLNPYMWIVNPTVHFNADNIPSKEDFEPVLEAYDVYRSCFMCPNCHSLLSCRDRFLTCGSCGMVHWKYK